MTESDPDAEPAAAERPEPPSFARWALGVLAPLAAYEAAFFIFTDKHLQSIGVYLIPMVYVAAYMYRYGVLNGYRRIHVAAASAFAFCLGLTSFAFPVTPGIYFAAGLAVVLLLAVAAPGLLYLAAPAVGGALFGIALTAAQWVAFPLPGRTVLRWLSAHILGIAVGAMLLAISTFKAFNAELSNFEGTLSLLITAPLAALPHLYLTWRAHRATVASPAAAIQKKPSKLAIPLARIGSIAVAVYVLVAAARVAMLDAGWYALAWPYDDIKSIEVFGFTDRPYGEAPIRVGDQEYLIPAELFDTMAAKSDPYTYYFVILRVRADSMIGELFLPPELRTRFVEIKISESGEGLGTVTTDTSETNVSCKEKHLHSLTVCWEKNGHNDYFGLPGEPDFEALIEPDFGPGSIYLFDPVSDTAFGMACDDHDFECEMVFNDKAAQVRVRFSTTLLPYWRNIHGWVTYQLEDFRRRAGNYRRAVD